MGFCDRLFPEKYTLKFSFCPKPRINTERVPPGHPIILLKSSKFNMAAVWVKRSINRDMRILLYDAGCGVGGPMINIAKFTRA